jgi:nicotinamidase-related amidase
MIAPDPNDEPAPYQAEEVLAKIRVLIDRARGAGAKVIYIRHREDDYPPMASGHPGFEVHSAIAPIAGETVLDKTACDSFCNTELESILRTAGVEHIVTCGMQTDACVDSTSRSATHRGINVTLATDAHTTWNNGVLTAEQIIAHHNRTLAGIPGPGTRIHAKKSADIAFASAQLF